MSAKEIQASELTYMRSQTKELSGAKSGPTQGTRYMSIPQRRHMNNLLSLVDDHHQKKILSGFDTMLN